MKAKYCFTFSSALSNIRSDHLYFIVQGVLIVFLIVVVDHNLHLLVDMFNVFQVSLNLFSLVHKGLHLTFQVLNICVLAVWLVQSVQDPDVGRHRQTWTSYEQHCLPINVFEALHGYGQGNILHSEVSYLVPINGY